MNEERAREPAAAPPDDGHQGSYTRPDEVMEEHAVDRPAASPGLHQDTNRQDEKARQGGGASSLVLILGTVVLFAFVVYFFLNGMGPR